MFVSDNSASEYNMFPLVEFDPSALSLLTIIYRIKYNARLLVHVVPL